MATEIMIQEQTQAQIDIQSRPPLEQLLQAFLQAQDVAPSSKHTYERQLKQFVAWLDQTGRAYRMRDLSRGDILAYKDTLLEKEKKAPSTVTGYLTAVRKLYQWLESEKVYPNIAKDIKGAKRPAGFRKDTLSKGQLRDVLDQIDKSSLEGMRDYALINLLARTGLRTIEIHRAQIQDIRQMAGQTVLWIQGKGHQEKDQFVLLTDQAESPLRRYLQARAQIMGSPAPEEPLFVSLSDRNLGEALTTRSISRIAKSRMLDVGLDSDKLTAHSLRHTAITMAIQGGASLPQAQAMARHSDPKTTMIYYHNLDRLQAGAERCISF